MTISVFDSYALEQANKLAKKEMSAYSDARIKEYKLTAKGMVLQVTPPRVSSPKKDAKKHG